MTHLRPPVDDSWLYRDCTCETFGRCVACQPQREAEIERVFKNAIEDSPTTAGGTGIRDRAADDRARRVQPEGSPPLFGPSTFGRIEGSPAVSDPSAASAAGGPNLRPPSLAYGAGDDAGLDRGPLNPPAPVHGRHLTERTG